MQVITRLTLAAAGALLPFLASAQVVTDPAKAAAARDSVLQQAAQTRQLLEKQTSSFEVRARRLGKRRLVTRGYASTAKTSSSVMSQGVSSKEVLLWKRVSWQRRNGNVEETFRSYGNQQPSLRQSHHNGQLTFLEVMQYRKREFVSRPVTVKRGLLTRNGYVRWGGTSYILPSESYRPAGS
jgi:hypothetical protein